MSNIIPGMHKAAVAAGLCWAIALPVFGAQAQSYPARPVKLVLPFGAGGSTDVIARVLAKTIGEAWGQQIIVENKPGADGDLGAETVARSPPDGYTLLLTSHAVALNASLRPNRAFKIGDLAPILLVATTQAALSVPVNSPAGNLSEFIAMAKAAPGKLDYGTTGVGTSGHLAIELLRLQTGMDLVHVPFRNIGQQMTDLIAGRLALAAPTVPGAMTHVRSGRIRVLAVTGKTRAPVLPDAPTAAEAGVPGYEAITWYGLFAPKGTPDPVIQTINADFRAATSIPETRARLDDLGVEPAGSTVAEFTRHVSSEVARWSKVVTEAKIKAD